MLQLKVPGWKGWSCWLNREVVSFQKSQDLKDENVMLVKDALNAKGAQFAMHFVNAENWR